MDPILVFSYLHLLTYLFTSICPRLIYDNCIHCLSIPLGPVSHKLSFDILLPKRFFYFPLITRKKRHFQFFKNNPVRSVLNVSLLLTSVNEDSIRHFVNRLRDSETDSRLSVCPLFYYFSQRKLHKKLSEKTTSCLSQTGRGVDHNKMSQIFFFFSVYFRSRKIDHSDADIVWFSY